MKVGRPKGVKDSAPRKERDCRITKTMVGKKFNRLFVHEIVRKGKQPKIRVTCDCGVEKIISPYDITKRKTISCGCYQAEVTSKRQIKPNNQSAKRRLFNNYKLGASTRGIDFFLSEDDVFNLAIQNCYYCGSAADKIIKTVGGSITVNGIDRVDNSIGYTLTNLVPCCKTCNLAKHYATKQIILKAGEFLKNEKF